MSGQTMQTTEARVQGILADLADLQDGGGNLGVVVRQALADDPAATAADVRAIWAEATRDAEVEAARA